MRSSLRDLHEFPVRGGDRALSSGFGFSSLSNPLLRLGEFNSPCGHLLGDAAEFLTQLTLLLASLLEPAPDLGKLLGPHGYSLVCEREISACCGESLARMFDLLFELPQPLGSRFAGGFRL